MNKKDKEEAKVVKKLIKDLKKGYGADCPELNIECGSCKAQLLISMLEWHLDNIEWKGGVVKKVKTLINKIKNDTKKSKTVGKF